MMKFNLYYADTVGQFPTVYPHSKTVQAVDDLVSICKKDHNPIRFKNDQRRKNENFFETDCITIDIDNDDCTSVDDCMTPEKIREKLQGVEFCAVTSRNHMKEKHKGENDAFPRWHCYFPLKSAIRNPEKLQEIRFKLATVISAGIDLQMEVSKGYCGHNNPETKYFPGDIDIRQYFTNHPEITPLETKKADPVTQRNIPASPAKEAFDTEYQTQNINTLLDCIPANCSEKDWTKVCCALINAGFSYNIFLEWSRTGGSSFTGESDCLKKWKAKQRNTVKGLNFAWIYSEAVRLDPSVKDRLVLTGEAKENHERKLARLRSASYGENQMKQKSQDKKPDSAATVTVETGSGEPLIIHQASEIKKDPEEQASEKKRPGRPAKKRLTMEFLSKYLTDTGREIKYNVITKGITISGKTAAGYNHDEQSLVTALHDELSGDMTDTGLNIIQAYLVSIARENRFNPVLEKIRSKAWDGHSRIADLFDLLNLNDQFSQILFFKWLKQAVSLLENDGIQAPPFGADGMLTLKGDQGIGKTQLVTHLGFNNPEWVKDSAKITPDKDDIFAAISHWINELAELKRTSLNERNIDFIKGFITSSYDEIRPAYAHSAIKATRTTSLIATINDDKFLADQTGNRRFWIVDLKKQKIDIRQLKQIDPQQLWAEADESRNAKDNFDWRLTPDEHLELAERNRQSLEMIQGEQEILDIFSKAEDYPQRYETVTMTATDFKEEFSNELRNIASCQIGRVLNKLNKSVGVIHGSTKYSVVAHKGRS